MLPKNLIYQTKYEASYARSYRLNVAPQNGTDGYVANNTIIINIPTRNNLVFVPSESYLKFKPSIINGGDAQTYCRFDKAGAHGFIRKIRVFHGSNLLEDIDNYEVLAKMMFDNQVSYTGTMGKYNILAGTRHDLVGKVNATGAAFTAGVADAAQLVTGINAFGAFPVVHVNSGENLGLIGADTTHVCQEYCINLMSMMGSLCNEKYFPLFACTSSPIRLEITLVPSANNTFATDEACSFTLNNVEYVMDCLELADSAVETIKSSLQGQALEFAITEYRNSIWVGTGSNGIATQHAIPINAKYSSLKSLFVAMRDNTNSGTSTHFPCSALKFAMSQYYFRIGGSIIPSKYPSSTAEYYSELCKALGNFGDIRSNPANDWNSYNMDTSVANNDAVTIYNNSNVNSGSFYIGCDLESYPNADKGQLFAGTNTNSDDIYLYTSVTPSGANNDSIRYDIFAAFDQILRFANNTCYCSY